MLLLVILPAFFRMTDYKLTTHWTCHPSRIHLLPKSLSIVYSLLYTHIHENLHLLATVSRAAKTASVANIVQHLQVITCRVGLLPERHDLPEKNTKGPHVWLTSKHTIHQRFRSHPPVNIAFLSTLNYLCCKGLSTEFNH